MTESRKTQTLSTSAALCSACGAISRRDDATFCLVCGKLLDEEYLPLDNLRASYGLHRQAIVVQSDDVEDLFQRTRNGTALSARACLVYSIVPYLGIVFVPFTILIGLLALGVATRRPELGGRKIAAQSIWFSFPVLGGQIFLWWLLYKIPEIGVPF